MGVIFKAPYHVFGLIIGYVKFLGRHNGDTNNDGDWGVERCIDDDAYKVAFKKFSSLYLKIGHQIFCTNVASSLIYWVLFLTLSYAFAYTSVWFLLWIGKNLLTLRRDWKFVVFLFLGVKKYIRIQWVAVL